MQRPRCVAAALLAGAWGFAHGANAPWAAEERADVTAAADLREIVKRRRCLPEARQPLYRFQNERVWLLEANDWSSNQLTATIAAILLSEHAGYGVDINYMPSGSGIYSRISKETIQGAAATERSSHGRLFGYANLEVWPSGQRDQYLELVTTQGRVTDMGYVGYDGRSGWFVSESFAFDPTYPLSPEFYRAYNASSPAGQAVLAALKHSATITCGGENLCCCTSAATCAAVTGAQGSSTEIHWCPDERKRELPAILSASPMRDQGFNEEIIRSNGLELGMSYIGSRAFHIRATQALEAGVPQLVHSHRPSLFHARLRRRGTRVVRVMLRSEGCGEHMLDGSGNWSCDFPSQPLNKLLSREVLSDPIVKKFFAHFTVPLYRGPSFRGNASTLEGAGMMELLDALASRLPEDSMGTLPTSSDIFDVACEWVKRNEDSGIEWSTWIEPRKVPFFADTLHPSFPYPLLGCTILISVVFVAFCEIPWLNTTFHPTNVRRILARNESGVCRTELELRLRQQCAEIPTKSPVWSSVKAGMPRLTSRLSMNYSPSAARMSTSSCSPPGAMTPKIIVSQRGLGKGYWKGLFQTAFERPHARRFWEEVEAWTLGARQLTEPPEEPKPPVEDYVYLAHHSFCCYQKDGSVVIPIVRSSIGAQSGRAIDIEVSIEECGGGAKAGKDFQAGVHTMHLGPGKDCGQISVSIKSHPDVWQNAYWFRVRLVRVTTGDAVLATPSEASVIIFDDDTWPGNIPSSKRGGWGISLMRYFIMADRKRRGEKWTKTMISMCWLPVHPVFVSTLVQKILVDQAIASITDAGPTNNIDWLYWECVLLALVQLVSLGLNRWADVVHTRSRGRTGGIRQVHRADLIRKFMHLEHSEHWLASDSSWLYCAMFDADVATGKAYFQVFVFAQSCIALTMSVFLVIGLAVWGSFKSDTTGEGINNHPLQSLGFILGVLIIIPLGLVGVALRRRVNWVAVIARKDLECSWFKSCVWIITNWRNLNGFTAEERAALEKRVLKQNGEFVPAHWDSRDSMFDTAWVTHWIQGVSYVAMLLCGAFALADYQKYGIGSMEVGTFYALCKIYLSVGKYVGRLSGALVEMQQAVVSLREMAALLNQADQRSMRREARVWASTASRTYGKRQLLRRQSKHVSAPDEKVIAFEHGTWFVRPPGFKVGGVFAELRIKACNLPLGRLLHVTARNERVLRSFLGLAAKHLHPTTETGEELPDDEVGVTVPRALRVMLLPMNSVSMGATAPSIIDQLELTGAPRELCLALAECTGLDPYRATETLGAGSAQVFSIVRAILLDPDVLIAFRPLALVPIDMRRQLGFLLRLWQGGGGLPKIARILETASVRARSKLPMQGELYRPSTRSLIIGNPEEDLWGGFKSDIHMDVDQVLWKEEDDDDDFFMSQESVVREEEDEAMMALSHMSSPKTRFGRGGEEGDDAQDIYGGA